MTKKLLFYRSPPPPPAVVSACAMLGWKGGGGGARKPKREIFISFLALVLSSSSLVLVGLASATLYNNDDLEDQEMHWEFETPWGDFLTKFLTFYLPHFYGKKCS